MGEGRSWWGINMIKVTYSCMKMFYVVYHRVQQMDEMYKTHREAVSPEETKSTRHMGEKRAAGQRERTGNQESFSNTLTTTGEFRSQRTRKTKG